MHQPRLHLCEFRVVLLANVKDVLDLSFDFFPPLKLLLLDELLLFSFLNPFFLALRDFELLPLSLFLHLSDLLIPLFLHFFLIAEFLNQFSLFLPVLKQLFVVSLLLLPRLRIFRFNLFLEAFFLFLAPVAQLLLEVSAPLRCRRRPLFERLIDPFQLTLFLLCFLQPQSFRLGFSFLVSQDHLFFLIYQLEVPAVILDMRGHLFLRVDGTLPAHFIVECDHLFAAVPRPHLQKVGVVGWGPTAVGTPEVADLLVHLVELFLDSLLVLVCCGREVCGRLGCGMGGFVQAVAD